jgi:ferredoxin
MDRKSFIHKSAGLLLFGGFSLMGLAASQDKKKNKYKVIAQWCDGCGHCYRACREKALKPEGNIAVIDQSKCTGCGECERFCRKMAIVPIENK